MENMLYEYKNTFAYYSIIIFVVNYIQKYLKFNLFFL